ncbi:uncharacterized protein N7479_002644 [Penicillium vulpinum]|uniref:uncharacterized protein n=1 Tax=Penicillium vulpinum TaxID=29845 RepID=UPI002546EB29|nr:uncharacterized protein N7479_002644 [Penicillium vulpinum]KAJ5972726.1 hypothetical protein N7479_002644 [Penicillium vulpinum]
MISYLPARLDSSPFESPTNSPTQSDSLRLGPLPLASRQPSQLRNTPISCRARVSNFIDLHQFVIPPGWTTNSPSPAYKEEWEGPESEDQTTARYFGLGPGRPIMEDDNDYETIFQSGDKFYLWDRMCDDVYGIFSRDINEVALLIAEKGLKELRREAAILFPESPNG